ncbi:hypothetical protein LQV63_14110 [Paenibacillus profundus]|uniref:ABC transporter permease n=1 Tax=Paenibacillus profundus TaxID=1173085 RepID=A0ABS8YFI6_9BACL|nr:hypothetical protein [Paenibacillus profundus]MCE5170446.1 hypothetical protein [Paenibacillus profundus]
MTSFQLYRQVYVCRLKNVSRRDVLLFSLILFLLPKGADQLTALLYSNYIEFVDMLLGYWLIGFFSGLSLFASSYKVEEVRFLWSLGQKHTFLTTYAFLKKMPFLLLLVWITVGQLLWNPAQIDVWQWLVMMVAGFSYAELVGYSYLLKRIRYLLISTLMLAINLWAVFAQFNPTGRITCLLLLTVIILALTFWVAQQAWPKVLSFHFFVTDHHQTRWLSKHPLLKKELLFIIRFRDVFPFVVCVFALELLNYYIVAETPVFLPISSALLIWFVNDIWTVRSFAYEGRGLSLYTVTFYAWRKMLSAKWFVCWGLGTSIAAINQLVWGLVLEELAWDKWLEQLVQSAFLSATMVSFGLLAGYRFTVRERIPFFSNLIIALGMIFLVYLHQTQFVLFVIATVIIHMRFVRFYRRVPNDI